MRDSSSTRPPHEPPSPLTPHPSPPPPPPPAALVDAESFERSLRLVISFGSLKRQQFVGALEERLAPPLKKARPGFPPFVCVCICVCVCACVCVRVCTTMS